MSQSAMRFARQLFVLILMFAVGAVVVGAQGDGQTVTSPTGAFSATLPTGWVSQPLNSNAFKGGVSFGNTKAAADLIATLFTGGKPTPTTGFISGLIGELDLTAAQGQAPSTIAEPVMQTLMTNVTGNDATVIQPPAPHQFGVYEGYLALTNIGYVAVMYDDTRMLFAMIISDKTTDNQAQMLAILDSIQIGATPGNPTPVTALNPEVTPGAAETFRSSDQRLSLDLPPGWTVTDDIAAQNTLAYGDSPEAAQSRLASARPDLAEKLPISGNGGLVILYPVAQFDVNPQTPDLGPLMTQALAQLKSQGYVTDAPIALESIAGGLYAYIKGTEVGYLALIPFGDQIAYVTATGTSDSFGAAEDALVAIIESVRSPAAPEPTGLGGLGGLEEAATPASGLGGLGAPTEPTATATVPALGGLAAPNATPEANS